MNERSLKDKLGAINGRDYGAYQSLKGEYRFAKGFELTVLRIPKDPYAPPHTGTYLVRVSRQDDQMVRFNIQTKIQQVAFCDYLARQFFKACEAVSKGRRGTGSSGIITINQPGQAILERNSVVIDDQTIEVRCFLGMPAKGRTVDAKTAEQMLLQELPQIVELALFQSNVNADELSRHIETAEEAEFLRAQLAPMGLVAFIADLSLLPRKSGTSDEPGPSDVVVPFLSPTSLKTNISLPSGEVVSGMGIPKGVTLIVGGGYHGKSTLLNALELGCYNHILGDGRERAVSLSSTVKVRAYSGRSVVKTDISPFIRNLPLQKDTSSFSTENASGSTSQAATLIEAMEAGAQVMLMDEDTCATNFMVRDSKMQRLVQKQDEPITAYIDNVKPLYLNKNISSIIVLGGVGDYFEVSDLVIQMNQYLPVDVTERAHEIARTATGKRDVEAGAGLFEVKKRFPLGNTVNPLSEYGKKRIYATEAHQLHFGATVVDLTDLEQLIELSQTKAIAYAFDYAKRYMDQTQSIRQIIDLVMEDIHTQGLDVLSDQVSGHFAAFRPFELALALNRLRGFDVVQAD